jgi:hypothetical protein
MLATQRLVPRVRASSKLPGPASLRIESLGKTAGHLVVGHSDEMESKMESSGRAGMEKSLCGNGLLQGSIPPAPARA